MDEDPWVNSLSSDCLDELCETNEECRKALNRINKNRVSFNIANIKYTFKI